MADGGKLHGNYPPFVFVILWYTIVINVFRPREWAKTCRDPADLKQSCYGRKHGGQGRNDLDTKNSRFSYFNITISKTWEHSRSYIVFDRNTIVIECYKMADMGILYNLT